MPRAVPLVAALIGIASALVLPSTRRADGVDEPARAAPTTTSLLPAVVPGSGNGMQLEQALGRRRSVRSYVVGRSLSSDETSRLLWAAQGVTDSSTGGRTAPSAGAIHPLEVYAITSEGVVHYLPESHAVTRIASGDRREALARAALGQDAVRSAAFDIVLAGAPEKAARKYGSRSERYTLIEAGHVAQNVLLEAVALGLGAVPIGAFDDDAVARVVGLPPNERSLYIIAVGAPRLAHAE